MGGFQSLFLLNTHTHTRACTHTELSGPAVLCHHTPPVDHLNGSNPDCSKSSRVHAEKRGGEGGEEGSVRGKETRAQEEMVVGERSGARTGEKKEEVWETVATRRDVKSMV